MKGHSYLPYRLAAVALVALLSLVPTRASAGVKQKTLRLPTGVTSYLDTGPAKPKYTAVLVHGWGDSAEAWRPVMERLSGQIRVVAYDTLGFGGSANKGGKHDVAAYRKQLERVVDKLKLGEIILVGHSMGAQIALAYAEAHPKRVAALHMIAPSGGDVVGPAFARRMAVIGELLGQEKPLPFDEAATKKVVRETLAEVLVDDALVTDALVERYTKPFRTETGRAALRQTMTAFRYDLEDAWVRYTTKLVALYPEGDYPRVNGVWGAEDPWFPQDEQNVLGRLTGEAEYNGFSSGELEKTGHLPHVENPQRFADDIAFELELLQER